MNKKERKEWLERKIVPSEIYENEVKRINAQYAKLKAKSQTSTSSEDLISQIRRAMLKTKEGL